MPQFVLIDHSLSGPGSHHYEYATHILRAAEQQGFEPVLASNRRFRDPSALPPSFRLFPLFRYSTYGGNTLAKPNRHRHHELGTRSLGELLQTWWDQLRRWRSERRQQNRRESFQAACTSLLTQLQLRDGDHVFLPTLSECDFLALSKLLQTNPVTRRAFWHLQFHFDFLEGRPPDYGCQEDRVVQMRNRFELALDGLAEHRLKFYSTTLEMADQYNRLGVAQFQLLPYPVNAAFRPSHRSSAAGRPLRAVCAGRVRDEKGSAQLAQLVADLGPDLLSTGKLQLLIQGHPAQLRRLLNQPVAACSVEELNAGQIPEGPIVQIPFPLPLDAYSRLIRQADLGLFLYDSYRYYARCSGVLVEMLCCGTPVIVPAGCWLAEEINEPSQTYLAWLRATLERLQDVQVSSMKVSGSKSDVLMDFTLPKNASLVSIEATVGRTAEPGSYLAWEICQLDEQRAQTNCWHQVHPCGLPDQATCFALPVHPRTSQVVVTARNAYHDHQIEIAEVDIGFHRSSRAVPRGAVGLAVAHPLQIGLLVHEMIDQFEHYRATARAFSNSYRVIHQARAAVQQLTDDRAAIGKTKVA